MDLEKSLLEDVFGGGAIPEEADKKVEKFALVTFDEPGKADAVAVSVGVEELLVGGLAGRRTVGGGAVGFGVVWMTV